MKKIMLSVFVFAVMATVSSCKCHTCTCSGYVIAGGKICQKDYNSTADYNNAVKAVEDAGCKCKLSM